MTAPRYVMERLSVPGQEPDATVEDRLRELATKADIAGLERQIAELKAWIARKFLVASGVAMAIAAIAVAVAEAIP